MECGFYHPDLGYWQTNSEPPENIVNSYAEGTERVPVRPSPLHSFVGGLWQEPTQEQIDENKAQEVRRERDTKLATEVDPIASNALRWASLTAEQQQSWADYRQSLLDVPAQAGFPHDVVWPTKPTE